MNLLRPLIAALCLALATTFAVPDPESTADDVVHATLEVLELQNPLIGQTGTGRGRGMERQSAGVAVGTGAVVEARVINGAVGVEVSLMTDDNRADRQVGLPSDGRWAQVSAAADSGVFFRLRSDWSAAPEVELRVVSGQRFTMLEYRHGDSPASFVEAWRAGGSPFAIIVDRSMTMLLPSVDRERIATLGSWSRFDDLDSVIVFYRHLIDTYDDWLGVEPAVGAHRNSTQRYFLRPDRNGWGYAYYSGGNYVGTSEPSVTPYLGGPADWVILHEIGHGYDGLMTSPAGAADIELGEVWNNIYGYQYQSQVAGRHEANWLYEAGKATGQRSADEARWAAGGTADYAAIDLRQRLDFMARITELTGVEGFRRFNRTLRDLAGDGTDPRSVRRTDLIAEHWGLAGGVNLVAWLETYGLRTTDTLREHLLDVSPTPLALPLRDHFTDADTAAQAASLLGLESAGQLVTPATLSALSTRSSLEISAGIADPGSLEGAEVELRDGARPVASASFHDGAATFTGLPLGTYTVRFPRDPATGNVPASTWVVVGRDDARLGVEYPARAIPADAAGVRFDLLGLADRGFATLTYDGVENTLSLRDALVQPHVYFTDEYARVTVTTAEGQTVLDRSFVGDTTSTGPALVTVDAPVGTRVTLTHRESSGRLKATSTLTGSRRTDLEISSTPTTYLVTTFGLVRSGEATQHFVDELTRALGALNETFLLFPDAHLAPQAARLQAALALLPEAHRRALTLTYKSLLDRLTGQVPSTPTPSPTPSASPTPGPSPASPSPTPLPTRTPTSKPSSPTATPTLPQDPYSTPGLHLINGRRWLTTCEPYSRTTRCRTEIWASVVQRRGTGFAVVQGWAFNNLTYLPRMTRAQWAGNPLGSHGSWTAADGRAWLTECDTAVTGSNGCRSYTLTTVYSARPRSGGGLVFNQETRWVFNNIVRFS